MLKIRLQRYGRTNDPSFRVVVLEGTEGPKSGKHVDQIGFYNAVTKQKALDATKAKEWLAKGAQPTDTVYNMFVTEGVIEGKKRNALPKKNPIVKEQPADLPAEVSAQAGEVAAPSTPEASAPAAEAAPEAPTAEEAPVAEAPAEAPAEEKATEAPVEEPKA